MSATVSARCPVCGWQARVRRDGHFSKHTRGEVGAYCPGSERDASAALAIDALIAESARRSGIARALALAVDSLDARRQMIFERHARELAALDDDLSQRRDALAVSETRVEALTLAALDACGWDRMDDGRWRDRTAPEREPVSTDAAVERARRDTGRLR